MTTARSYCSGYAGLEMSVRAAFGDFEVLSHSDIKPASQRLLAHHYPHIPNLGDMRAIDYTELERPDLMIGSWPCQPHSAAGKRLGEADPRDLWPEYERAIDAHRPTIFFGENVARIASNGELRRVVRSLAQRGYVGAWRSVRASDVGACHRRDRMFVVAVAADAERFELWDQPGRRGWAGRDGAGVAGHDGAEGSVRLTLLPTPKATDGTKGGPGMRGSSGDLMLPSAVMQLLPTPTQKCAEDSQTHRSGGRSDELLLNGVALAHAQGKLLLTPTVEDASREGSQEWADRWASGEFIPWPQQRLRTQALNLPWGRYGAAIEHHEQVFGRPAPAPTTLSPRTGNPQLSARFVEWMMMVPEGHVTGVPDLVDSPRKSERNAMLSLLGDGVVPAQGAAAFSFLLAHLAQRLAAGVAA